MSFIPCAMCARYGFRTHICLNGFQFGHCFAGAEQRKLSIDIFFLASIVFVGLFNFYPILCVCVRILFDEKLSIVELSRSILLDYYIDRILTLYTRTHTSICVCVCVDIHRNQ